jgi:hypothetical protein
MSQRSRPLTQKHLHVANDSTYAVAESRNTRKTAQAAGPVILRRRDLGQPYRNELQPILTDLSFNLRLLKKCNSMATINQSPRQSDQWVQVPNTLVGQHTKM